MGIRPRRVAIIGAGVTGLRCASVLLERDFDVTVFEARDRVGGRTSQTTVDGHPVDLGPNWIHGTKGNPIVSLVRSTNTAVTVDSAFVDQAFLPDGTALSVKDSAACVAGFWYLIGQAEQFSSAYRRHISAGQNLLEWIDQNLWLVFQDQPPKRAARLRLIVRAMATLWGTMTGETVEKQSVRNLWIESNYAGSDFFVSGTYKAVLNKIAERPVNEGRVRLSEPVVQVCRRSGPGDQVRVTTSKGEYFFDEVVVTAPLGWLKINAASFFVPALPARMTEAVAQTGFACLDKIYLSFRTRWWERTGESAGGRSTTTSPVHTAAALRSTGGGTNFVWTAPPEFDAGADRAGWIASAYALPGPPVLLFYTQGPSSKYLAKQFSLRPSMKTDKRARVEFLSDFVGPYLATIPGFVAGDGPGATVPTDALATLWATDEWAGFGSYTYFPAGEDDAAADLAALRASNPIGWSTAKLSEADRLAMDGVWIAGEHTAPTVAIATVPGAYLAGQAVAENIVRKAIALESRSRLESVRSSLDSSCCVDEKADERDRLLGRRSQSRYDAERSGWRAGRPAQPLVLLVLSLVGLLAVVVVAAVMLIAMMSTSATATATQL